MPRIFIKGLDDDNNLVNHQFCTTLTHEITIEGIPRPLKFTSCYMEKLPYYTNGTTANSRVLKHTTVFRKRVPLKPFHEKPYTKYTTRAQTYDHVYATNAANYWTQHLITPNKDEQL